MRECNCLETHIPRNGHTLWPSESDDYANYQPSRLKKVPHNDYHVPTQLVISKSKIR